jgi:hypothetical protein
VRHAVNTCELLQDGLLTKEERAECRTAKATHGVEVIRHRFFRLTLGVCECLASRCGHISLLLSSARYPDTTRLSCTSDNVFHRLSAAPSSWQEITMQGQLYVINMNVSGHIPVWGWGRVL